MAQFKFDIPSAWHPLPSRTRHCHPEGAKRRGILPFPNTKISRCARNDMDYVQQPIPGVVSISAPGSLLAGPSRNSYLLGAVRLALGLCLLATVTGCSQSVKIKVDTEVPVPTVSKIALTLGVFYDPALRTYAYTENSEDRPDWKIESGDSQIALFDRILPSMFQAVTPAAATTGISGVAGVFAPRVAEMQFALPTETKTEIYEAWIKYQMQLYDGDGQLVAEWPVTGYGKAETAMLKSKDDGISTAINLAMRDAGAKLALGFEQVPEVRRWLSQKTKDCKRYGDAC